MSASRCDECGASYADPSDSCTARFDALLALDHSRQEPWGSRHGLAFAVFALQHPSRYPDASRLQSFEVLYRVFLKREPLERVIGDLRRRAATRESAPARPLPLARRPFAMTIADLGEFGAETYSIRLDEWCLATLAAFGAPAGA